MPKNPYLNAIYAALYISGIVSVINYFESRTSEGSGELFMVPIAFLSLFVLSAAVTGYLFLAEPIQLFLEGNRQEAVTFFLKTVAAFAAITLVFFGMLLYLL